MAIATVPRTCFNRLDTSETPIVINLKTEKREGLATTIIDARPEHAYEYAGDSIWPAALGLACGATFTAVIFHPIAMVIGPIVAFAILFAWFWQGPDPETIALPGPQEEKK